MVKSYSLGSSYPQGQNLLINYNCQQVVHLLRSVKIILENYAEVLFLGYFRSSPKDDAYLFCILTLEI